MDLIPRVGTFFLLVGTGALALFVLSIMGHQANVLYLLVAIATIPTGFIFRGKRQAAENDRFSSLRKMKERNRQRRQERHDREKNRKG